MPGSEYWLSFINKSDYKNIQPSHDQYFIFITETGERLSGINYKIYDDFGGHISGKSNIDGCTNKIEGTSGYLVSCLISKSELV
ncbi:hypothetical protein MPQ_0156 [Methylovorus sp. MP688]|nr:hypothetical protein MPQ_0156 [Methylovorus sp. MP688]